MPLSNKIPKRYNWVFNDSELSENLQLQDIAENEIGIMFNKTFRMFDYKGLPDGITYKDMERYTQLRGKQFFIKYNERFYIIPGDFINTDSTWNNEATKAKLVNVELKDLKPEYTIDDDCILYNNDSNYIGLLDLFKTKAIQIASVDISLLFASIQARFKMLLVADDDNTRDSINKVIGDTIKGVWPAAITGSGLLNSDNDVKGIPFIPPSSQSNIKDLIELRQYLKSTWYMDLGIDANYNMKREAINENEAHMNDDALLPLIDDMYTCRKVAIDKINRKWGLNISIEYSSSWRKLRDEILLQQEKMKAEALQEDENNDNDDKQDPDVKPNAKEGDEDDSKKD